MATPSIVQVDLFGYPAAQNLDVYVINEDFRVLNPTYEGTSHATSEQMCLVVGAGAYYPLVTNAASAPSAEAAYFLSVARGDAPKLTVPGDLDFGETCLGEVGTLTLNVCNTGGDTASCHLDVEAIQSSNPQFAVTTPSSGFPVSISADFCFPFQVKFTPTASGPQTATLTIPSNDPVAAATEIQVSGTGTLPDIRVVGSGDFGAVCADDVAERRFSVCNVGPCDLNVTGVSINCPDFTLVSNPFPAVVSPDSCLDAIVRFTPTSAGPKACKLTVTSDDPDTPVVMRDLTGDTPLPSIDVPPDLGFPPTVIQDVAACSTPLPFPVSNTGQCDLEITDYAISSSPDEYSLFGLPSFPILLEPGHIAGEGDLRLEFAPDVLDRDRLGQVAVTYVSEPILGTTTTIHRALCGEGARTGARVLVTQGGVPLPVVKSIKVQRLVGNRNGNRLDTVDNVRDVPLQVVTPAAPCGAFQFHREYSTISNPIQLAPGSYQVTVAALINGKLARRTVGFDVSSCTFNPTIVVNF